jgi:hypothetical protein
MPRYPRFSWWFLLAMLVAASGCFALGFDHMYEPTCTERAYQGVCIRTLLWFGLGFSMSMLAMAKFFDEAMRYLDSV